MKKALTTALLTAAINLVSLAGSASYADPALISGIDPAILLGNTGVIDKDTLDDLLEKPPIDATTLLPDITISNLSATGAATATPNRPGYKNVPVSFTVHNTGNVDITQHFDIHAYIHDRAGLRKYLIPLTLNNPNLIDRGISSGASVRISGTLRVAEQDFFSDQFFVIADSCAAREFSPEHCDIRELDENNNRSNTARL